MGLPDIENLVYDLKLSSVGPADVTASNTVLEPSNMDLAMKLHYLRGLYFFKKEAVEGLTIYKIKESMFFWLNIYYQTCGRFRRSDSGRPFIRCNDCGVRIIEAKCRMDMDDFLQLKDCSLQSRLFYNQVIGPELTFSPLVMIQLTWFQCGGMSVGMRWSHVLGDAFSATDYINLWGQMLTNGYKPSPSLSSPKSQSQAQMSTTSADDSSLPLSVKRIEPVGDYWITPNNCKMGTISLELTAPQLANLHLQISDQNENSKIPYFASISAVIWQCLAKIREESEPKTVTICRNGGSMFIGNNVKLSVAKANFSIAYSDPKELVALIMNQNLDESSQIEEMVGKDQGVSDYIVYGTNPTFVDLEGINLYGLELNGMKPVFANYVMHGVGDEGVVLVLPSSEGGRTVTITLPENQVSQLKTEMMKDWNIS